MFWKRSGGTSLGEIRHGLRVRKELFSWGTTPADAGGALGILRDDHASGWRHVEAPCAEAYGFQTVGMTVSAPALDRPITGVSYELARPSREPLPDPAVWADPLAHALGPADEAAWHEVPSEGDPSGAVRYYARWRTGEHAVGLSVYGGPRDVRHGTAAGCLWLSWSTLAAAAPFLPEWRSRAAELVQRAAAPTGLTRFPLGIAQHPRSVDGDTDLRAAHYALNAPDLLPTPSGLGIAANSLAIWRATDDRCCASTAWETVLFRVGEPVTVRWLDILPAKGGGSSSLEIGNWEVRDVAGSPAVQAAAKALADIPAVRIERVEGYDC